ncbi:MAG: OmpH family outer membrane protein [Planctomycetes bacterium]|nr:OmpH family outer membrane protein [Planctomycetota bacterium]
MKTKERFVIYFMLMALIVINLSYVFSTPGTSGLSGNAAYAEPLNRGDILGPADGLELLASDEDENLTLRNVEGRLSWGDAAHHRAYSIGYVHLGRILNHQLAADEFEEERQAMLDEIQEKDQEYRDELNRLNEQIQELEQDSPEGREIRQRGNILIQEYRSWQQQTARERDQLAAEHLERAYRELIEAVNIVADHLEIDLVHRFIPTDDPFEVRALEQAMMAVRLRPALRYPEDLDITLEVMEELSLEFE